MTEVSPEPEVPSVDSQAAKTLSWREEEANRRTARLAYNALPADARYSISHLDDEINMAHIDLVRTLLDAGADVNGRNILGDTPLKVAAYVGSAEIVRLLLERGADIHARDSEGLTALEQATRLRHAKVVAVFHDYLH
ncbi:hypothetical protein CCAX7_56190 [Capsulimonas corticalis]|uniref:Uncharacterized protein n=1 Tax=Capsulimonas corticalis TaxID=2219043 RepID=A0A402D0J9_9BACT|nr:ankyrin repeat domain-containing protein [Capsulimonas corticalis]BDI33568.1 hypothetical protein CCAX7_56190 [Capsulimonas corticalis]